MELKGILKRGVVPCPGWRRAIQSGSGWSLPAGPEEPNLMATAPARRSRAQSRRGGRFGTPCRRGCYRVRRPEELHPQKPEPPAALPPFHRADGARRWPAGAPARIQGGKNPKRISARDVSGAPYGLILPKGHVKGEPNRLARQRRVCVSSRLSGTSCQLSLLVNLFGFHQLGSLCTFAFLADKQASLPVVVQLAIAALGACPATAGSAGF